MTNVMLLSTDETSQSLLEPTRDQNGLSVFQSAFLGNTRLYDDIVVVTSPQHYFTALDQIDELKCHREPYFLLESLGKGSAASVLLACHSLCPESIVLISYLHNPMENKEDCKKIFKDAEALAKQGLIIEMHSVNDHLQTYSMQLTMPDEVTDHAEENPENHFYCFEVKIFLEAIKAYFPELYETSKQAYKNAEHNEIASRIFMEDIRMIPELHFHELLQPMNTLDQKILSGPIKRTVIRSLKP